MFRCDPMAFCDMFLQPEAAFEIMSRLGAMSCVQFLDMNTQLAPYLKNYIGEVCRCDDVERKLRYIETEIMKENLPIPDPLKETEPVQPKDMTAFENMVEKWESDILDISENQVKLKQDLLEMKEMAYVLSHIGPLLGDSSLGIESIFASKAGGAGDIALGGRLYVMTGVVKRTRSYPFQMMLWRVSRGNIYYKESEYDEVLEDPYTGGHVRKVAFLALCQGEMLYLRMQKIISGFRVNLYPCPDTIEERTNLLTKIRGRIIDLEEVNTTANYYRCSSLREVSKKWQGCLAQMRKTKAIYHTMNLFTVDITKNCLIGQCWLPEKDLKKVQETLETGSRMLETEVQSFICKTETTADPPTTQRTNKFTYAFQILINAYGGAKYMELNPGLYTIITFPFLFAIMFGDGGHAVIIVSFAVWMIIMEKEYMKQKGSEIWEIFFGGRYVMLLLGMYSLFTGFVYNDIFSRSINLSNSMWLNTKNLTQLQQEMLIKLGGSSRMNLPYFYGLDPIWPITKNKILIENSIKMKMSLIIGVIHMIFGISLSVFNHVHFKKYYAVVLQFIPEILFLICLFFWLVIMIFYKWMYYYDGHKNVQFGSSCAPVILILFIDMFLYSSASKGDIDEGCEVFMFELQQAIQRVLVTVALALIPVLLFGTPIFIHLQNKKKRQEILNIMSRFRVYRRKSSDDKAEERIKAELAKYSVPFSELMIHQGVHTIEFVLSTVSHTASYLRLWALSLAHSQLSEMLWVMVLSKLGLRVRDNTAKYWLFIIFPVWAFFTVAILVVMEGLSCFLHTLRLHWFVFVLTIFLWVEFMSKFYIGGGYSFQPFSFKTILAAEGSKPEGACSSKNRRLKPFRESMESKNVTNV